jgi:hypothetical protein
VNSFTFQTNGQANVASHEDFDFTVHFAQLGALLPTISYNAQVLGRLPKCVPLHDCTMWERDSFADFGACASGASIAGAASDLGMDRFIRVARPQATGPGGSACDYPSHWVLSIRSYHDQPSSLEGHWRDRIFEAVGPDLSADIHVRSSLVCIPSTRVPAMEVPCSEVLLPQSAVARVLLALLPQLLVATRCSGISVKLTDPRKDAGVFMHALRAERRRVMVHTRIDGLQ